MKAIDTILLSEDIYTRWAYKELGYVCTHLYEACVACNICRC